MTKKRTFSLVILREQIYLKNLKYKYLCLFFIFLSTKHINFSTPYFLKING